MGLRTRLFLISALLLSSLSVVGAWALEGRVRGWFDADIEDELRRGADAAAVATGAAAPGDLAAQDALADALGAALNLRVTLVDAAGRVLGDSGVPLDALRQLESHADRPEIVAARRDGLGVARRRSATLNQDMLYVARPLRGGGVARVARPLGRVDETVEALRAGLAAALVVGLVLALGMTLVAAHWLSEGLWRQLDELGALVAPHQRGARRRGWRALRSPIEDARAAIGHLTQTLAQERDRFDRVLEAMGEAVVALELSGTTRRTNRVARTLLGLPEGYDGPLVEALDPARRAAIEPLLSRAEGSYDVEFGDRMFQVTSTHIDGHDGLVLVFSDVTRLRRLERVRRDFVANMSHELRTPVSVIRLNVDTLLEHNLTKKRGRGFAAALARSAERLSDLVGDLLQISRIESGRYPIQTQRVSVAELVATALESVQAIVDARGTQVVVAVARELRVRADPKAMTHVLINLLENAAKYTAPAGRVTVEAVAEGAGVRVEVRDDGPGIPPEHRDRIFERFYRVDKGRSKKEGGTGLGLAIVKHLVAQMEGEVGVRANAPVGSVFWLTLPIADQPGLGSASDGVRA